MEKRVVGEEIKAPGRETLILHCLLTSLFASAFHLDPPQPIILILQAACKHDFLYHLSFRPNSFYSDDQPQMRWTREVAVPLDQTEECHLDAVSLLKYTPIAR